MIITHTVPSSGRELTLTRTLDAAPHDVFQAWVDPERAREWMGPRGFRASVYREIVPDERLVFTVAWDEKGRAGHETTVIVNLVPRGGKTMMTFRQGTFESMSERDSQRAGWNSTFDRLAAHVREE